MESALEKALSNPGLGVLLLDDTNRALAEDVEQLRQEVAGMDQVWKAENEVHKHNTQRTAEMNQMLQDIQASCLGLIFDVEVNFYSFLCSSTTISCPLWKFFFIPNLGKKFLFITTCTILQKSHSPSEIC